MTAKPGRAKAKKRSVTSERGSSLQIVLKEVGIHASPSEFLGFVRDATEQLRTGPVLDPGEQLSTIEAEVLERGGFSLSRARPGKGRPLSSTVAAYVAMMDEALSVAEAAKRLRVDQSRIRQLLANGSLYGMKLRGEWRLPRFQFTARGAVPGIHEVLRALPQDLHPVEVLTWLGNPDPDLEIGDQSVSPLDWLRSGGDPERASEVARDL
jgi:excisionase family DNA binding protein